MYTLKRRTSCWLQLLNNPSALKTSAFFEMLHIWLKKLKFF